MPHVPGLDGLRGLAVVAVVLYHALDTSGLPAALRPSGGFLGVEVFFVLSGFLITALLVGEHERTGTVDLRSFWIRRARRLLPALFVFLAGVALFAQLLATDALAKIRSEILGALVYVSNWLLIVRDESYFEAAGRPSLLRHLWSLAIEEQFYLVWPVIVLVGLRVVGRRPLFVLTVAGAIGSTALMWQAFGQVERYGDVTSIYYRTDTRAAALLVGAAAAMVWQPWNKRGDPRRRHLRAALREFSGLGALAVVVAAQYWFTDDLIAWDRYEALYRGGFLVTSLATVVLIASVVTPGSLLGRGLGTAPLRWLGTRSYGLYLWHWPVFQLTRPRVDVSIDGWELLGVRLAVTVVLVEASYRLIELPIRERRFLRSARTTVGRPAVSAGWAAIGVGLTIACAAALTLPRLDSSPAVSTAAVAQPNTDTIATPTPVTDTSVPIPANRPSPATTATPNPPGGEVLGPPQPTPSPVDRSKGLDSPDRVDPTQIRADLSAALDGEAHPAHETRRPPPRHITVFGDSVMLGAEAELGDLGENVTVDARIGRQWWQAGPEISSVAEQAPLGDILVVQLGNNGSLSAAMFDEVMAAAGDTPVVVFVTVRVPRRWESEVNRVVADGVARWGDRALLADWHQYANERPEFFDGDGVHLNLSGRAALRDVIAGVITQEQDTTETPPGATSEQPEDNNAVLTEPG